MKNYIKPEIEKNQYLYVDLLCSTSGKPIDPINPEDPDDSDPTVPTP